MKEMIIYQIDETDLKKFFNEELAKREVDIFLSRFNNVFITPEEVANIHGVNKRTVYNYVNDGLLVPEIRIKNEMIRFRLPEALRFDFKAMRKQIRLKHKLNS